MWSSHNQSPWPWQWLGSGRVGGDGCDNGNDEAAGVGYGSGDGVDDEVFIDNWRRLQREYRANHRCELSRFLKGPEWEQICNGWTLPDHLELHHILGRNKKRPDLYEVRSNWIIVSGKAHHWATHNKKRAVLACLWAKCRKSMNRPTWHDRVEEGGELPVGRRSDFSLIELDRIAPAGGVLGYVGGLMDELGEDDPFWTYGERILSACEVAQ